MQNNIKVGHAYRRVDRTKKKIDTCDGYYATTAYIYLATYTYALSVFYISRIMMNLRLNICVYKTSNTDETNQSIILVLAVWIESSDHEQT